MTERTNDERLRASGDRESNLRGSDDAAPPQELDAIESDEVLGGDQPVPEIDTSGVTRTHHSRSMEQPEDETDDNPLFGQQAAADFRARWGVIQSSFVDDPQHAVRSGDELVTEVIQALNATFTDQRMGFDTDTDSDGSSTEAMRLALRRYRSFFERLLTI
jgi:hypothetical protein